MNQIAVHKATRRRYLGSSRVVEGGIIVVGVGTRTDFSPAGSDAILMIDGCPFALIFIGGRRGVESRIGRILPDLPGTALRISR